MIRWSSCLVCVLFAAPVWAATGGPDGVGYRWMDSDEQGGPSIADWNAQWSAGPSVISSDDVVLSDDPRVDGEVTDLLFTFPYYGDEYSSVNISSNGFIFLGDGGNSPERQYASRRLPDNNPPDGVIAPAWTDWNPGVGRNSGVWVHSTETEYVVVWRSPYYGRTITNEAAVRLTPDGEITFFLRFLDTNLPGSGNDQITIGVEAIDELEG
ncbi:MAG: hypothetical protein OSB21_13250, partial [Myxococcota bacterium]|nr:hypothetical protein [Myxococcota bacterium]